MYMFAYMCLNLLFVTMNFTFILLAFLLVFLHIKYVITILLKFVSISILIYISIVSFFIVMEELTREIQYKVILVKSDKV